MSELSRKLLKMFCQLFKGNTSFFVKHQPPFTEKEGKLTAKWVGFATYNRYKPPPEGKSTGDYIPVTEETYREHLNGGNGLALSPLMNTADKRNVCFYAAIDIDVYGVNFTLLVRRLYQAGFKFAAFISKSGGLHVYFFFADPEPGSKVIEALEKVVEVYGLSRLFVNKNNKSKVEIFPKQSIIAPGKDLGSCLFLPFYNAANKGAQNMLTAEGKLLGITKALPAIDGMFTSVREINDTLRGLPYGDAPYCVQVILLNGALRENDGRNSFLFHAAMYLKKKYTDGFEGILQEMNDCLEAPLEQADINSIYTSVITNGYDKYPCKAMPCAGYCDKKLCALREYGANKKKDNRFTGADNWGQISMVMAAQPYYLWDVRVNPGEPFKEVRLESVKEVQNQIIVQERCLQYLNWSPFQVKPNEWITIVNDSMQGIEERKIPVPEGTDTTEMGELRRLFLRFLAHAQAQHVQPYMIGTGQVCCIDEAYYFTTEGFTTFLRYKKFSFKGVNLRERLISYGCADWKFTYKNLRDEEKVIPCWKKAVDEELSKMSAFYEDVYEGDADVLRKNKSEEDKGSGEDENVKF
jgi:hypothetical protein